MKRIADLRSDIDAVDAVEAALDDAAEMIEAFGDEPDAQADADASIAKANRALDELEIAATFDRPYDSHGAIMTIRAGAGGTDAADWTQMLARMYLRWAENHGYEAQVVDEAPGEEAGLRSITFIVRGKNAYGMLESERGVHRLVRISPFDNQGRRQTSFAEVDVVPEMEAGDADAVELKPDVQGERRGWPVRQQDRIGDPRLPSPDRHHRRFATGTLADAEPRGGAQHSAREAGAASPRRARAETGRDPRRAHG
jgi:peptide chain release factor 2